MLPLQDSRSPANSKLLLALYASSADREWNMGNKLGQRGEPSTVMIRRLARVMELRSIEPVNVHTELRRIHPHFVDYTNLVLAELHRRVVTA